MARSLLLLLTGALIGGGGVYLVRGAGTPPDGAALFDPDASRRDAATVSTPASAFGPSAEMSGVVASRVDVHQQALEATDALDLETMIQIAAAAPRSRSRDLEIEVLLARLAELDPRRAVAVADSVSLETLFLLQAFAALAREDTDSALAELAAVSPSARQRRVAVALLDIVGSDERGVARIAAALPERDRASFAMDALIVRAEVDLIGALDTALEYDMSTLQAYLLPGLAEVASRRNASGALAYSEAIRDSGLRLVFQQGLLGAWAEADPEAVFAWLPQASGTELMAVTAAFRALADTDADRLLALADEVPLSARNPLRRAVMQSYAEDNPVAALALLETIPLGRDRETMLETIARTYGQQSPDSALAWVRTLSPPSAMAMQAVLQGIATVDADRAIDAFIATIDAQAAAQPASPDSLMAMRSFATVSAMLSSTGADVGRIADRLLESGDAGVRSMLTPTLSRWASSDVDAALNWTLTNAATLDPSTLANVARQLADANPDLALSTLDRLPAQQRAGWLEGLATQMASSDIEGAMSFVDRYRGQPGYAGALGRVLQEVARSDPARAARALTESASSSLRTATFTIAREWANRDPAAAARWAVEDLSDPTTQTNALNMIASAWGQRDAAAAERWMFSLQSGPSRDAAADGLMMAAAQVGRFEPRVLEAYSSDASGQRAASQAIIMIGRNDPNRAGDLMDAYLTDPSIRARTEEQIARLAAATSGSLVPGASIIF